MLFILMRGFYFITDRRLCSKSDAEAVREAVEGGAVAVQYREKELPKAEKIRVAKKLMEICGGKVLFIVNNDVDVAVEVDADGVHLGQGDMSLNEARRILGPDKIIGVTVHNVAEAIEAEWEGADYVGASPIFATTTKEDAGRPAGLQLIRDVRAAVRISMAAIGGINESNINSVIDAGADMACAISATVSKEDIRSAVKYFAAKWTR
jgi:thiamine-phosphate pyrophosphorylase